MAKINVEVAKMKIANDTEDLSFYIESNDASIRCGTYTADPIALMRCAKFNYALLIKADDVSALLYEIERVWSNNDGVLLWASVAHPALDAYRAKGE